MGAGHQTCGWRCGYMCLWWALWIGNRGGTPSGGLPQALPTMQGTFPALCQSLLQEGYSANCPGRGKRSLSPATPIAPPPKPKDANIKGSGPHHGRVSINDNHTFLLNPITQGPQPSEPPEVGLAHIYILPPPLTATPRQLYSLNHLVPPPKRRRVNPPEVREDTELSGLGTIQMQICVARHRGHHAPLGTWRQRQRVRNLATQAWAKVTRGCL